MDPSQQDDYGDEDDIIQQQAALAAAKFGGLKKKTPMVQDEKTKFDSADHFSQVEKMKQAATGGADTKKPDGKA